MSGKNRAFALAVATAALVGLSAPVASAASFSGPSGPSGFNGDSVLNVSGNQLPIQACNNSIPVNVLGIQVPLSAISAAGPAELRPRQLVSHPELHPGRDTGGRHDGEHELADQTPHGPE